MAEDTKIEWCDATFNSWRGCTRISEGCRFCYAETMSKRNPLTLGSWGPSGTRVVASESKWREPEKWNRLAAGGKLPDGSPNPDGHRPRVFCASLGDVFEDWQGPMVDAKGERLLFPNNSWEDRRPWIAESEAGGDEKPLTMDDVRRRLFDLIDATPHLDWLILTKRPENIAKMMPLTGIGDFHDRDEVQTWSHEPRPNLWIGTSVENKAATSRIDILRSIPAAVRFLSVEPMLEDLGQIDLTGISWVIVGCESGRSRRPMQEAWAQSIADQCKAAGVSVFMKQMDVRGKVSGDVEEFAIDLRIRSFPTVNH